MQALARSTDQLLTLKLSPPLSRRSELAPARGRGPRRAGQPRSVLQEDFDLVLALSRPGLHRLVYAPAGFRQAI